MSREWFRERIAELDAVYDASLDFRVRYWATLLVPGALLAVSAVLPTTLEPSPYAELINALYSGIRLGLALLPPAVAVLMAWGTAAAFRRERSRLRGL